MCLHAMGLDLVRTRSWQAKRRHDQDAWGRSLQDETGRRPAQGRCLCVTGCCRLARRHCAPR